MTKPFHWNDSFHDYIAGRRREGAMITQRAVSVRLKKEGLQHMTDFEDMSNAFACTSADRRAEVLEELINETDRLMFVGRVLNSTVRCNSDEGHFFASPQCGNLMGSSEGPIFFLAALCPAHYSVEHADDGVGGGAFARCCRDRHRQAWNAIWDTRLSLMTWQKR